VTPGERCRNTALPGTAKLRSAALGALAALTLLRLGIAAAVPLVPDEAYYWVWSRALAPGYPDHPPMVALWIRLGTTIAGDGPLGVRLLSPLSVAIASLLLADAGDRLLPGRGAGLKAAALLNATLLFGVGGILMTPDAPLLAFWIACLWALARLFGRGDPSWWMVAGLFAGLAMASKYTAALLWFGIALWVVITPAIRPGLRRAAPWLGGLLAVAVFLPVVIWEAGHGWPSFTRQSGRIGAWHPAEAFRFLSELLLGQVGLVTPLIFAFCVAGVIRSARTSWRTRDPAWTLLAALTLPAVAVFTEHALGDRVQGNWPAILYPAAVIAAGGLRRRIWDRLLPAALALGLAITLLVYFQAGVRLLPLPASIDPIVRQLDGWDALAAQVADAVRAQPDLVFVAADQYGVAAELARTLPADIPMIGVDGRWEQTGLPRIGVAGKIGILVSTARIAAGEPAAARWSYLTKIGTASRRRGSETVEVFWLYRVTGPDHAIAAVLLPRS
jgi:4-amino-4-deoxy-L-arabinose transferase-like glycosyltransferase